MIQFIAVGVLLGGLLAVLLACAPQVSESLVRRRAGRLPPVLAERMEEEWLAELDALSSRPSQLAFAIALSLTRRHSFASEEDGLLDSSARPLMSGAAFGGWPGVVTATTLVFAAVAYLGSFLITPMYRSTGRLELVPSRLATPYPDAPARPPLRDRVSGMTDQVMSPRSMEGLIREFELYGVRGGTERGVAVGAELLERLRANVSVEVLPDGRSFEVSYDSPDPKKAAGVALRLMTFYIMETSNNGRLGAEREDTRLDAQIRDVRSRLLQPPTVLSSTAPIQSAADAEQDGREQLKATYRELLTKREHVLLLLNMERRAIGENLRLIERPRLPETPFSPNRPVIAGEGAAAGLLFGLMLMLAGRSARLRRWTKALARP
jgi:hypothetical protein